MTESLHLGVSAQPLLRAGPGAIQNGVRIRTETFPLCGAELENALAGAGQCWEGAFLLAEACVSSLRLCLPQSPPLSAQTSHPFAGFWMVQVPLPPLMRSASLAAGAGARAGAQAGRGAGAHCLGSAASRGMAPTPGATLPGPLPPRQARQMSLERCAGCFVLRKPCRALILRSCFPATFPSVVHDVFSRLAADGGMHPSHLT